MKKVALIVDQYGMFQVQEMDDSGHLILASDESLEECLRLAANLIGPLVIPVSAKETDF